MLFTSESVTQGHPDKVCDTISDTILDACLAQDPSSRVAVDTWVKDNTIGIIGELTTQADLDFESLVREAIVDIGYDRDELGFNGHTCQFLNYVGLQSPEIHQAVDKAPEDLGAGDQGLMFGYASNQTEELMPLPILLSHRLAEQLHALRTSLEQSGDFRLRPDGKTQVTIRYSDALTPESIDTIIISSQHHPDTTQAQLTELITKEVITPVLARLGIPDLLKADSRILINPSGSFILGGPVADSGLTGRKIVVDGYGGWGRVGGGAFSGKDPSKVDRSAAYMARYLAKQIVALDWAEEAEVQLSYAIGVAEPVSVHVTGKLRKPASEIERWVQETYDLRPFGIIQALGLVNSIYQPTSAYGHFGRPSEQSFFSWEKLG